MELAGVVLGAVPVLVEALKAWKIIHQKFRVFRHYSKEVKRIHDKAQVQQCVFENEIEDLLVTTGIGSEEAQNMLGNLQHPRWTLDTTNQDIKKQLTKSAEVYQELLLSIASSIGRMNQKLQVFDCVTSQQRTTEKLKETVLRLRSAVRITFTKTEYEKELDFLRQDIADLRTLRSYRASNTNRVDPRVRLLQIDNSCKSLASTSQIREACSALYEALEGCWSCANKEHVGHAAKLCLEARVEDGVRLDLALACNRTQGGVPEPLWLHVKSLTQMATKPNAHLPTCATASSQRGKRVKIVAGDVSSTGRDLRASQSICDSLSQCHCLTASEECLGYVESQDRSALVKGIRHHFYHRCTRDASPTSSMMELQVPAVLESSRSLISIEYQLRLAHTIATSVLQLYSTPWMRNEWRLNDISLFQTGSQDVLASLDTLHLTTHFKALQQSVSNTTPPPSLSTASSLESSDCSDEQCLYGVPNLMLFSLGVALLEISHRQSLEHFSTPRDQNNTYTARRLAQRPSSLGRRYQSIAQRCLQCDFGCGSELAKAQLQSAVYTDVVCELGEMLNAFTI